MSHFVHPTAIVDDGALIGDGTSVWHHVHVRSFASIGDGCVLGKNVYIDEAAVVGDRCKVQNNVSVYRGVVVGDDVFIGPGATFTNDLVPRAFNTEWTVTPTTVESGCSIGANATIVCGLTIGRYSMIAAGATVTRDVAPHQLVGGIPARHMGWVCRCGMLVSRSSDSPESFECDACRSTLQRSGEPARMPVSGR